MAIVSTGVYAYTNENGVQQHVKASQLTYLSDWSSATTYATGDAVDYLGALYYSFVTNTNVPPSGNVSATWSVLVLVFMSPDVPSGTVHVTADGAGVPIT